jgi:hypothetical protein
MIIIEIVNAAEEYSPPHPWSSFRSKI